MTKGLQKGYKIFELCIHTLDCLILIDQGPSTFEASKIFLKKDAIPNLCRAVLQGLVLCGSKISPSFFQLLISTYKSTPNIERVILEEVPCKSYCPNFSGLKQGW